MADTPKTHTEKRREAEGHLIKLGYAQTFEAHNAPGLTDYNKVGLAMDKFRRDSNLPGGTTIDGMLDKMRERVAAEDAREKAIASIPTGSAPAQAPQTAPQPVARKPLTPDPKVAEAQAYLRVLGYNGQDNKNDVGKIDGLKGGKTKGAMDQFARDHNIDPKDGAKLAQALKEKATSPEGLAKMKAILEKSGASTVASQDVKAVQTALLANGVKDIKADGIAGVDSFSALDAMAGPAAPQETALALDDSTPGEGGSFEDPVAVADPPIPAPEPVMRAAPAALEGAAQTAQFAADSGGPMAEGAAATTVRAEASPQQQPVPPSQPTEIAQAVAVATGGRPSFRAHVGQRDRALCNCFARHAGNHGSGNAFQSALNSIGIRSLNVSGNRHGFRFSVRT